MISNKPSKLKRALKAVRMFPTAFAAWLTVKSAKRFARKSDAKAIRLFARIERLLRRIDPNHPSIKSVVEIKEIFQNSPEERRAIRQLLLENRDRQFISFIRGFIRHYLKGGGNAFPELSKTRKLGIGQSQLRIGILGADPELDLLVEQYANRPDCEPVKLASPEPFATLDGLEIAGPAADLDRLVQKALDQGIAVSVHLSSLENAQVAWKVLDLAKTSRSPFRLAYPYYSFFPVLKVKELIDAGEIGEVGTVRVRAILAGHGGQQTPTPPDTNDYLSHPAFDHFLLLALFGGPIEKVAAYLNPMEADGGQAQISCKYSEPGRCGQLELCYAPKMYVRSTHLPFDLEAEISGTDGVIWLRRGMGERIQTAPIAVRIGKTAYTIGVESGMPLDWEQVYRNQATQMVNMIRTGDSPTLDPLQVVSALEARTSAGLSSDKRAVMSL